MERDLARRVIRLKLKGTKAERLARATSNTTTQPNSTMSPRKLRPRTRVEAPKTKDSTKTPKPKPPSFSAQGKGIPCAMDLNPSLRPYHRARVPCFEGDIPGCPLCNTLEHSYDSCKKRATSSTKRALEDWCVLVKHRAGLPPIRSTVAWPEIVVRELSAQFLFITCGDWPITKEGAKLIRDRHWHGETYKDHRVATQDDIIDNLERTCRQIRSEVLYQYIPFVYIFPVTQIHLGSNLRVLRGLDASFFLTQPKFPSGQAYK